MRERDRILRCIWTANRWRRGKNQAKIFTRQFSRLLTPAPSLSVFHGNLPQEICDTTSPMFIMGNLFPSWGINELEFSRWNQKFSSSYPYFDIVSKFPGSDHSCRKRYVNKLLAERKKKKNNNEIYIREAAYVSCAKTHGSKVVGQSRDHALTFKQRFSDVWSNEENFRKKSPNGHATVVVGHATVGRLSINVFRMFQAIRKHFEKSHWTVTTQWSEVTRSSANRQTTFFGRFKQLEKFLNKVAERSRDSGRRSRDRRPTVKERSWTFQAIRNFWKKVAERSRDSGWRSRDRQSTVKQRFLDVSSN